MSRVWSFEFIEHLIDSYSSLAVLSYVQSKLHFSLSVGRCWGLRCWHVIYEKSHLGTKTTSPSSALLLKPGLDSQNVSELGVAVLS